MNEFDYVFGVIEPWLEKFFEHGVISLTPVERVGVGIWLLQAEVNNGGFDLYFHSQSGDLAVTTVAALRAIGANETASLLEAANAEFPEEMPPQDQEQRQEILDEISETARFSALEQDFYAEHDDLIALMATYLKQHADDR